MSSQLFVESVLSALGADDEFREEILGDLAEELTAREQTDGVCAARLWYYREALRTVPHLLRNGFRHAGTRGIAMLAVITCVSLLAVAAFGVAARSVALTILSGADVPADALNEFAFDVPGLLLSLGTAAAAGYLASCLYRRAPLVASLTLAVVWLTLSALGLWLTPNSLSSDQRLTILITVAIGPLIGGVLAGSLVRSLALGTAALMVLVPGHVADAQPRSYSLESTSGVQLHNVVAQPAILDGKKGLRVIIDSTQLVAGPAGVVEIDQLVRIEGVEFSNGVIEAEVAGAPAPGAAEGARGFVGIAFRLRDDMKTYDAFYLRPTNGRADDQERRNHATQYISHPDWTWSRLRRETPSRYESYVDLVPNTWTKIRIEVRGQRAKLYVHDRSQPSLIVNDVKSGATAKGGVALWIGAGTIGHFRNLTVTREQ